MHKFANSQIKNDRLVERPKMLSDPSLNTQSCIKKLLVVQDFWFWAVWVAGPVHKKESGAYYEQLLRSIFYVFEVKKNFLVIF